jgi:DMSO reductase iron-sulfur subunit
MRPDPSPGAVEPDERRPGFVFDTNLCTGCQACQLACVIENDLAPEATWRRIHTFNERRLPGIPLFHLSLACNHCAEPCCLEACPALAYSTDPLTGAVLIDEDKCIGCRYCSWACPYDAPRFDDARGLMTKCTFCNDRLPQGGRPACVESCPTAALGFDRLSEKQLTHEVPGFPRSEMRPSIRIVPLRSGRSEPEVFAAPGETPRPAERPVSVVPRVTLRSEWSLAAFTFLAALLVGWLAGSLANQPGPRAIGFPVAAAAAMALGSAHLGRKTRTWRAILGFRRSWLSREIVFFSAFAAVGSAYVIGAPTSRVAGTVALLLGLAALFSMDRVYRYALRPGHLPHSAGVLLTGIFLSALLSGLDLFAIVLGILKLVLYVARIVMASGRGVPPRLAVASLRIALGVMVLPAVLLPTAAGTGPLLLAVLVGELVDRCEFYAELDFPTPARRMVVDLAGARAAVFQPGEACPWPASRSDPT